MIAILALTSVPIDRFCSFSFTPTASDSVISLQMMTSLNPRDETCYSQGGDHRPLVKSAKSAFSKALREYYMMYYYLCPFEVMSTDEAIVLHIVMTCLFLIVGYTLVHLLDIVTALTKRLVTHLL